MTKYYHATSSATLVGLKKSQFVLCSSDVLIRQYGVAPIAGEISLGGHRGCTVSPGIAFASAEENFWPVSQLITQYGTYGWKKKYQDELQLAEAIKTMVHGNLVNLWEVIIQIMREIHMGEHIKLSEQAVALLWELVDKGADTVKKHYIRNYIFTHYLKANRLDVEAPQIQGPFMDFVLEHIPLDFLDSQIQEQKGFIKKIDSLFTEYLLSNKLSTDSHQFSEYFRVLDPESDVTKNNFSAYKFDTVLIDPQRKDFIDHYFYSEERVDPIRLSMEIKYACSQITENVALLKKAIKGDVIEFNQQEKKLCTETFPIIFILEEPDPSTIKKTAYEYRVHNELKIGRDIKTIATNPEHKAALEEFFDKHGVCDLQIISTTELNSGVKPKVSEFRFLSSQPLKRDEDTPKREFKLQL
ncbi:hypothetical protein FOLKNPGA_00661 [Legionella sp. PC1000]|uniref:hypothetical protein n=1 Tax=Legionella sp. PC1000 TaxID=2746060 RepID=UPI0015F94B3B|nr:hypothetical protein [Legionella sp. PC1000]QLZ67887.1 hypothetical protein FOLKNPGA_00661 [Legionella sp. PC1000]